MLPSNLLRVRISKGRITPVYVSLDPDSVALGEGIGRIYGEGVGRKRGELVEELKEFEGRGYDFKLVRGLSALLERRCVFEAKSAMNPVDARRAVFGEASRMRVSSREEKSAVLRSVSAQLGISPEALEETLFSDTEDELVLKGFVPLPGGPDTLLRYYNLAVTQTLLFKALRLDFSASGNWKNIFRDVKRLGLIYSVERQSDDAGGEVGRFRVSLDGPLSLFKMTERYGTSMAKLLPQIIASDSWTIRAEILVRNYGGRVYNFEAESKDLKHLLITNVARDIFGDDEGVRRSQAGGPAQQYDSATEEKFARSFLSYGMAGWSLRREAEPLVAGTHVLIPDFRFEKDGLRVYLEVVGFWTPDYLERKLAKLGAVAGVDMIIAADESLACSKLERLREKALVIYYRKEVPIKPIIEHLRERETSMVREEVQEFEEGGEEISLKGDLVSLEEVAKQNGLTKASVRMVVRDLKPEGYVRAGDWFISTTKLKEMGQRLEGMERLTEALAIIEASGIKDEQGAGEALQALGYTSVWEDMDMDKARIVKLKRKEPLKEEAERGERAR